ncbi:MAG: hypothetical protein ABI954_06670 [Pyrinomonadaceae bacterium]
MRRCPTCQRTFDDNMKFCQADGTPLLDEAPQFGGEEDPFKTVLAETEKPSASEPPDFDPMKTMLAAPPQVDLPPPSPFGDAFSVEPKDTGVNAPSFGDLNAPQFSDSPLPSESFPQQQPSSDNFGQQQSGGFGSAPRTPTFQEPEPPQFGQQPNFGQQPFGEQPFGQQPAEWIPPPVPQAGWDNQGLGQNTPFNPPPVRAGINQTLPIVSLGLGAASITIGWCCSLGLLLAPAALITGFIGLSQIKKNPQTHGGKGLAIGGMATAGVFLAIYILIIVLYGAAFLIGNMGNFGR